MGDGRSLRTVLLLLQVWGLCGALREGWIPGEYTSTPAEALRFLADYNSTAEEVLFFSVSASWDYNTNITSHNSELQVGRAADVSSRAELSSRGWNEVGPVRGAPGCWRSPLSASLLNHIPASSQQSVCVTGNVQLISAPVVRTSRSLENTHPDVLSHLFISLTLCFVVFFCAINLTWIDAPAIG